MSEPMTERRKRTTSGVAPTIRGHDEKTTDVGIVEHAGLEPATLCLQSRCATSCANTPSPRHGGGKEVRKHLRARAHAALRVHTTRSVAWTRRELLPVPPHCSCAHAAMHAPAPANYRSGADSTTVMAA